MRIAYCDNGRGFIVIVASVVTVLKLYCTSNLIIIIVKIGSLFTARLAGACGYKITNHEAKRA
jgi:hypothetical protein